jgi:hypothetical protein
MSNSTGLIGMARQGRLDIIAGLLGLLAALAMMPLQLFISQIYIRTLPVVLGVASLLYLLAARDESHGEIATFSLGAARLLPNLVVLGSAGLVVIAALSGARTLLFYDIAAAIGTALFAQILFIDTERFSPGLLLFQIILFGLVFRFCALYTTPGFIGIDVWTHIVNWSRDILAAQSLNVEPFSNRKYYASPLYHLLVVGSSLLLDTSLRMALYLVIGIAMPLSVLLIYSTAAFFVDARWAVFATAAYSVSASVIEWGIHIIPTSLGLIFFLAVFYSLDRMLRIDYKPRDFGLVVFFSVAVILTHQVSAFIMLVFTGSGLLAYFALSLGIFDMGQPSWSRSPAWESVNLTGLLVFDLGLITFMWSLAPYQGSSFLLVLFDYFATTVRSAGVGKNVESATKVPPGAAPLPQTLMDVVVKYVDVLGFLLLLLLTVVGCLYIIRQENISHATFTSVVATVAMLVFIFVFPLFGIETFVPGRWYAFIVAPMAVVGAIGLSYLVRNTQPSIVVVVLLLFVVVFPATSLLASEATQEHPPFTQTQTRYGYTEPELAAVHTLTNLSGNNSSAWLTDHPYTTVFDRITNQNVERSATKVRGGRVTGWTVQKNASAPVRIRDGDTFIYREYQSKGASYFSDKYGRAYTPTVEFQQVCGGRDILYTNGEVTLCNAPGT